ncbi:unnamed protein product, partial [Meganyctiphanes norvegica]
LHNEDSSASLFENIWMAHEVGSDIYCSKVYKESDMLLLPSLKKRRPPSNAMNVPFDILAAITNTVEDVYLMIQVHEREKAFVRIHLHDISSLRTKIFRGYCLGVHGISYTGPSMINKSDYVGEKYIELGHHMKEIKVNILPSYGDDGCGSQSPQLDPEVNG